MALKKSKKLFVFLIILIPLGGVLTVVGAYQASQMVRDRLDPVIEFVVEAQEVGFANTSTTDFRPLTWLDSLDMVDEKPLTGFGPGSYRYLYPEFRKRFTSARAVSGHPHNEYLEIATEYGWIGFALFAVAWIWGGVRLLIFSLKSDQQHHAFLAMAFLGTIAGTMFHSFFDFQMHVFQNALVFALLAAVAVGPMAAARRRARRSAVRGQKAEGGAQSAERRVYGRREEPSRRAASASNSAYLYPSQDETGGLDFGVAGGQRSEVGGQRSGAAGRDRSPSRPTAGRGGTEKQPNAQRPTPNASKAGGGNGLRVFVLAGLAVLAIFGLYVAIPSHASAFIRAKADRVAVGGNDAKAITYYQKAVSLDDTNWRAYKGHGSLLDEERYYILEPDQKKVLAEEATQLFGEGYKHNSHDAELVVLFGKSIIFVGRANGDMGRWDEGLDVLRKVKVLRPFNDLYWWTLGGELRKAGYYEEALDTFVRAHTIRKSVSSRKNIEWLKEQLNPAVKPKPVEEEVKVEKPELVIPEKVEVEVKDAPGDGSLDELFRIMEGTNTTAGLKAEAEHIEP